MFFCDTDIPRAQQLAAKFAAALVVEPADLGLHSLDALFVCTPPVCRGPLELAAISNRVPFFVEKPIGLCADQALPVLNQLLDHPTVHAVGYMNRCRDSVRFARALLANRRVLGITSAWVGRKYRVAWWAEKNLSGGPFNEQATHVVDLFRYLAGEIDAASSVSSLSFDGSDLVPGMAASVRFVGGQVGTLLYSCEAREKDIRITVFCEDGTLDLEGWDFRVVRNTINGELPQVEPDEIFLKETRIFLDAVRRQDQSLVPCDLREAYQTQKVVDQIRSAAEAADLPKH
jgi:predicted dehydrogenase